VCPTATAPPELAPADRLAVEQALTELWRSAVDRLTVLSVALHSRSDDPDDPAVAALDAELASVRRTLGDVEEALRGLAQRR
jgi:hypothetical protein